MDAHKQRLEQLRNKRKVIQDNMNTSNPSNRSRNERVEVQRQFSTQKSQSIHVAGSIIETYEKQIQCALQTRSLDSKPATHNKDDDETLKEFDLLQPKEHRRRRQDNRHSLDFPPAKVKQLNQEELESLVRSKNFNDFFNKSSKFVEKVLDYGDGDMIQELLKDGIKSKQIDGHNILTQPITYSDPNFTANRVVTDIDWSTQISELFLASYSQNEEGNIKDHVGVVLVWTPTLKNRPEFYCFCQSPVTSAKFFPYSNSTIIGGCYNGQLLLWDVRAKAMPVQRSGISSDGHKYPVYSLNVVGTQIANNIVSFSNDGTMGLWDAKQLNKPVRQTTKLTVNRPVRSTRQTTTQNSSTSRSSVTTSEILGRNRDQPQSVNVTCCKFPLGDANKYYVGSLNGAMYKNATHNNSADNIVIFDEHDGPISGISINNPSSEYQALSGLILTSSFDWTVKLWSPQNNTKSLRTFEHSDDYIYDVDWNPENPSIFATVNNDGNVDLFDLTRDVEQPIVHKKINNFAQNKCRWNKQGSIIMSGDSAGNLHLSVLAQRFRKIQGNRLQDFESILKENTEQN